MTTEPIPICQNCNLFRHHYIWFQGFQSINYGHCVRPPRVRHCRPNTKACEQWIAQTEEYRRVYVPNEEASDQ